MSENSESSPVEPLKPAAPGRREPLELAARVMSIVMLGWLAAMAGFAWMAYDDGYTSLVLPIWNSVFVLGMVPIVQGVFKRRLWGQRWVAGVSIFTGISNAWQASRMDSTLLWFGALLLFAVAMVVRRARPLFNDSDGNRGRIQQLVATIVTVGSVVISLLVLQGSGSERGRASFAREVQASYDAGAPGRVHVQVIDRGLVIESIDDTNEQIDAAADSLQTQLSSVGPRAKAWAVGFEHIVITNGSYTRTLTPRSR
ncbi:MAG TPA: hypothetical protein VFV99_33885 [Kofleriaceae bacterium]|nr:hypothetical protein [Kofleriaceae bacterium]